MITNVFKLTTSGPRLSRSITTLKSIEGFRSNIDKHRQATEEKRNLILSILQSTSGKREARDYLKKYSLLKDIDGQDKQIDYKSINDFKLTIEEQKVKTKYDKIIDNLLKGENDHDQIQQVASSRNRSELELSDTLRIAIIKVRDFEHLSHEIVKGIGLTIYSIIRLGVSPIIVVDNDEELIKNSSTINQPSFSQMTYKIIEQSNKLLEAINLSTKDKNYQIESRSVRGAFEIDDAGVPRLTLPETLLIPLSQGIIPIVYPIAYNLQTSKQDLLTTTQVLECLVDDLTHLNASQTAEEEQLLTVEKIIFIDPEGGIPSIERFKSSHVLINFSQEYEDVQSELYIGFLKPSTRDIHLKNLSIMKTLLDKLPNATGIITTPEIATLDDGLRHTNPIIYNVLTDRPVISSSLPVNLSKTPLLNTTIMRKGVPVKVIESPHGFSLNNNPEIDLAKLKLLINDSFRRELNLDHYLDRIGDKVLCVIIAGDYQGAAIVTKELDGMPYLDKFAVSSKSQGSSGVADIIFKCLLNQFPEKLIWRSRKSNPVNKWYFDRSKFNLALPNSNWKVFYSGSNKIKLAELENYLQICENIEPSWLN